MSLLKQKFKPFNKIIDVGPLILLDCGKLLHHRMKKERLDEDDILESAREMQGLERIDQIRYAILEIDGRITIIPQKEKS